MINTREQRAKMNIAMTLCSQVITIICGLIAPRLLLQAFGSEIYGATASIVQFLSYITLIEGGVGGIARAALYSPLAKNDKSRVFSILHTLQHFFNKIGFVFFIYVLIIACSFKSISSIESLDWLASFLLVIVISLSTFAQYFWGITNAVLLQADQKLYIVNAISICTTILNTLLIVGLIYLDVNVIAIKLVSSFVYIVRPLGMSIYVKRKYGFNLRDNNNSEGYVLKDKWTGLGQHIAYFVHSNTDIVILTLFSSLENVAVYSVYYLIISNMQSLSSSFSSGMEGLLGEMYAKKETDTLNKTFNKYETLLSVVGISILCTTAVMIVPFIKLYTNGITDAEYINPLFATILTMASFTYIARLPYHNMVIASGHFKQTRMAAYGEAIINISVSLLLVGKCGVVGVALGTAIATLYRLIYYVFYLSTHIIYRPIKCFIKRSIINCLVASITSSIGFTIVNEMNLSNYYLWAICGVMIFIVISLFIFISYIVFYRADIDDLMKNFKIKFHFS